ncbi:MAG: VOC family protein [Dehalococcoidia bacterium]
MKIDGTQQGRPSWVDLTTTDVPAAIRFYESLFGWTGELSPIAADPGYYNASIEGAMVAGITDLDQDQRQRGVPSHWNVYLAVDDVEATAGRVQDAGGQVLLPPMDVMGLGNMAMIADPTGGIVGLWQAKTHRGFGVVQEPGAISWCELITDEPERASAFYTRILDVGATAMPMGDGQEPYTLLGPASNEGAGIMRKTAEMGPMPNVWGVYFEVADCDATVERARELGATILNPPTDIMPGRFAMIADPQGAVLGVITSNPMSM